MRVIITGASGFTGQAVISKLELCDWDVIPIVHQPSGLKNEYQINRDKVDVFSQLSLLLRNDVIIHLSSNVDFSSIKAPAWSFLHIKEQEQYTTFEIKTFFLQEMFKRGILTLGSHNLSFSHTVADVDRLLEVYRKVLPMIKRHIDSKNLKENIHGDILQDLFKVR